MNIVVTGSIAYDYIMSFPGYFKEHVLPEKVRDSINLSFLVDTMVKRRGGVGRPMRRLWRWAITS